jgi:hypothetical protein
MSFSKFFSIFGFFFIMVEPGVREYKDGENPPPPTPPQPGTRIRRGFCSLGKTRIRDPGYHIPDPGGHILDPHTLDPDPGTRIRDPGQKVISLVKKFFFNRYCLVN